MRTLIPLNSRTREELRKIGHKQQTYDSIVNELLKKVKESSNAATLDDKFRSY